MLPAVNLVIKSSTLPFSPLVLSSTSSHSLKSLSFYLQLEQHKSIFTPADAYPVTALRSVRVRQGQK